MMNEDDIENDRISRVFAAVITMISNIDLQLRVRRSYKLINDLRKSANKNTMVAKTICETCDIKEVHAAKSRYVFTQYKVGYSDNGDMYIQCLNCLAKSYNTNDILSKYCPFCHNFHER